MSKSQIRYPEANQYIKPLQIPVGPWTDISYNLIAGFLLSHRFDRILRVIDRLTRMAHFMACTETVGAKKLANLMLLHVWKLYGTPTNIVSNQGSIFMLQVAKQLNKDFDGQLHLSTAYHPRNDIKSDITTKYFK